jgi:hypothetical protein
MIDRRRTYTKTPPARQKSHRSTSIYLTPELDAALKPRVTERTSRSEILAKIAGRYHALCERDRPALSVNEWRLVCDALNGVWMRECWALQTVWAEIADAIKLDGLDSKHGVDGPALVTKLHGLTYGQTVALVDVVEHFWNDPQHVRLPGEEATD